MSKRMSTLLAGPAWPAALLADVERQPLGCELELLTLVTLDAELPTLL